MEGLILRQSPSEDIRRKRPKSAKGDRRTFSRDGRTSSTTPGDSTFRTLDVETINEKGVQELFSDILYETEDSTAVTVDEYKDDFENDDDENTWSDDSPLPHPMSASVLSQRSHLSSRSV